MELARKSQNGLTDWLGLGGHGLSVEWRQAVERFRVGHRGRGAVLMDVLHVLFAFESRKKKEQAQLEEKEIHMAHIFH
jgi:hypothetical protein